jgi:hypothetical protein
MVAGLPLQAYSSFDRGGSVRAISEASCRENMGIGVRNKMYSARLRGSMGLFSPSIVPPLLEKPVQRNWQPCHPDT